MAVLALTGQSLRTLRCPDGKRKIDYFDSLFRGLLVEVRSTGSKCFYVRYVDVRGKQRQQKLGDADTLTVAQARGMAKKIRAQVLLGQDVLERKRAQRSSLRFEEFVQLHYLPFAKTSKRSWETDECLLRVHLLPALGKLYLDEIKTSHIIELMNDKRAKYAAGTVNRMLVLVRYIYNLADRWGVHTGGVNPTKAVSLLEDLGARERFLTSDEAEKLLECLKQSDNQMLQHIVPWLLLTGARKSEALKAKWSDVRPQERLWYIPTTKTGRPRGVPLSDAAVALLNRIPRFEGCPWVFPNPATLLPFVSIFYAWDTARKRAGLADVRIHDLRHSAASFLVNSGESLYVVQKVLGHTQQRTTARYSHLSHASLLDAVNRIGACLPFISPTGAASPSGA